MYAKPSDIIEDGLLFCIKKIKKEGGIDLQMIKEGKK